MARMFRVSRVKKGTELLTWAEMRTVAAGNTYEERREEAAQALTEKISKEGPLPTAYLLKPMLTRSEEAWRGAES